MDFNLSYLAFLGGFRKMGTIFGRSCQWQVKLTRGQAPRTPENRVGQSVSLVHKKSAFYKSPKVLAMRSG